MLMHSPNIHHINVDPFSHIIHIMIVNDIQYMTYIFT